MYEQELIHTGKLLPSVNYDLEVLVQSCRVFVVNLFCVVDIFFDVSHVSLLKFRISVFVQYVAHVQRVGSIARTYIQGDRIAC